MPTHLLMSKTFLSTVMAIVVTGAMLNMANRGTFGAEAQKLSKFVTTGYGAGAL